MGKGIVRRFVEWIDGNFGFTRTILRPAPEYSLRNPAYWLGALAVVAFFTAGVAGIVLLQYYEPHPDSAWESVSRIVVEVPFGNLIRNIHIYAAFSMIFIAFLHFMRNYFVIAYRKPRELMWMVGMALGFATLMMGFTGYLLPWYALSYAAVGFGITIIKQFPQPISGLLEYLVSGYGTDIELLRRFYVLHTVILPATILILLIVKIHIFEVHGITESLSRNLTEEERKLVPWFPNVFLYFVILVCTFLAAILLASIIYPFGLHEKYTPGVVTIPMPEWYFMWTYAIAKTEFIEALGETGFKIFVAMLTAIALVFVFLPFIDRWKDKHPSERPYFIAFGVWMVVEVALMTYLAWITAGGYIPSEVAIISIVLPAAIIFMAAHIYKRKIVKPPEMVWEKFLRLRMADTRGSSLNPKSYVWNLVRMMLVIMGAGLSFRIVISSITEGAGLGWSILGLTLLAASFLEALRMVYVYDMSSGNIRRRLVRLERWWGIGQ